VTFDRSKFSDKMQRDMAAWEKRNKRAIVGYIDGDEMFPYFDHDFVVGVVKRLDEFYSLKADFEKKLNDLTILLRREHGPITEAAGTTDGPGSRGESVQEDEGGPGKADMPA